MQIPDRFISNLKEQHIKIKSQKKFDSVQGLINQHSQNKQKSYQQGSDIAICPSKNHHNIFSYQENFQIILQAQINKKTLNSFYKSRYFVLTTTRLLYFDDKSKNQLKGCFNFVSLLKHNISIQQQYPQIKLKLLPKYHQQTFINRYILQLQFQQKSQFTKWFTQLTSTIKKLQYKSLLSSPSFAQYFPQINPSVLIQLNQLNSNFWNKLDISIYQFKSYSSHLDILLLRSKNPVAYVSRFFMRSYYDHVALLLRSQMHEVYVFQATQARGVSLMDLETFLQINKEMYEEIGYRKLIVEQTEEEDNQGLYKGIEIQRLQMYLNSLVGKKYQLSLVKLLADQTNYFYDGSPKSSQCQQYTKKQSQQKIKSKKSIQKRQSQKQQKQQKTYFCSQLIADIYLKFGILENGKANDFWPKDFQSNQMKFKLKCHLSPIMNVIF